MSSHFARVCRGWFLVAVLTCCTASADDALQVEIEPIDQGARISVGGELFAEYLTKCGHRPAVWPIVGPTGEHMTRAYPMQPAPAGGTTDHPHHRSLWFGHEGVAGGNTWTEPADAGPLTGDFGAQVHRDFVKLASEGTDAVVSTINEWQDAQGTRLCEDQRTLRFHAEKNLRWIDFTIRLSATEGDVEIHDTKEGTFALRVPDSMTVDAKQGGRIVNSRGQTNDAAWGMPAEWVDYSGPVEGETVGIAILSHPANFRPAPRWHVRTYGLFAANPFGEADFPAIDGYQQGARTIRQGDALELRYRVILHLGDDQQAGVASHFERYRAD